MLRILLLICFLTYVAAQGSISYYGGSNVRDQSPHRPIPPPRVNYFFDNLLDENESNDRSFPYSAQPTTSDRPNYYRPAGKYPRPYHPLRPLHPPIYERPFTSMPLTINTLPKEYVSESVQPPISVVPVVNNNVYAPSVTDRSLTPQPVSTATYFDTNINPESSSTSESSDSSLIPQPDATPSPNDSSSILQPDLTISPGDLPLINEPDSTLNPNDSSMIVQPDSTTSFDDSSSIAQPDSTSSSNDSSLISQPDSTPSSNDSSLLPQPDSTPTLDDPSLISQPDSLPNDSTLSSNDNPSLIPQPDSTPGSDMTSLTISSNSAVSSDEPSVISPQETTPRPPSFLQPNNNTLRPFNSPLILQPVTPPRPHIPPPILQPNISPRPLPTLQPGTLPHPYNPQFSSQPHIPPRPFSPSPTPRPRVPSRPYNPLPTPQPRVPPRINNALPILQPLIPPRPSNPLTTSRPEIPTQSYNPLSISQPGISPQPYSPNITPRSYTPMLPIPGSTTEPPVLIPQNPLQPVSYNFSCSRGNGYYGIPGQCDTYIECQKNVTQKFLCPDGLHFNPRTPYPEYPCSYPSEVKCNGALRQKPKPTNECRQQYGFYAAPDGDCSEYLMCQGGRATVMHCPLGLVFNEMISSCDWPINVPNCNPDAFKGFSCPTPTEDDEFYYTIYKYRYGRQCKRYIACQSGHPRLLSCDEGLSFDEETQLCIAAEFVTDCDDVQ